MSNPETTQTTGAEVLVGTLADLGVTLCFANPGTSEMHLVAALDGEPRIRSVLCLFEGVATGAADGFARIARRPAMTLLHLGPGYAYGAPNTHNARRAFSPVINIVGDHATGHAALDAPLTSDIAALAATSSVWVAAIDGDLGVAEGATAVFAACMAAPGGPATLIVPADRAWSRALSLRFAPPAIDPLLDVTCIDAVAVALRSALAPAILLGGEATASDEGLAAAARLASAGITLLCDTFVARQLRGGERFEPTRLAYFSEDALAQLAPHDLLVLAGTTEPVSFFAYPGAASKLVPASLRTMTLCARGGDAVVACLSRLADALDAPLPITCSRRPDHALPEGGLTAAGVGASLARHMSAETIISDDAVTSSGAVFAMTAGGPAHDWLSLTGGAIGQGLPVAIGAALARPGARVIALTGDGAGMYTPQALWTIVRERLDIIVVVFANHAYRILDIEYQRTGAGAPGPVAASLLTIGDPVIDWCLLARAMGMEAVACNDATAFDAALADAMTQSGPTLLEARIA